MTPPAATLTDLDLPQFTELAAGSPWIRDMPGLGQAFSLWQEELPPLRTRLEKQAKALGRPTIHPDAFSRLGVLTGRVAAAMGRFAGDLPTGIWRSLVSGQEFPIASELAAVRLSDVVRTGGPSLVKLGQFIATAQGLLPDEIVSSFAWCRDRVPVLPPQVVHAAITEALGAPPDEIFASFHSEPLASASIAQAHEAVTPDGRAVVVKVQRPDLERHFTKDLRAMALLAFILERTSEGARAANLRGFVELFANLVLQELDFRLEASNMVELGLAAEHAGADFVVFPRPLPTMVSRRVIVMEKLDGVPYTEAEWDRVDPTQRARLLRLVIAGVIEHTLVYGVFHGDLHAGNVLATPDGLLGLVDYGIVGRMTVAERAALTRFLVGFALGDNAAQLSALVDFGALPADADLQGIAAEIDAALPRDLTVTHDRLAEALSTVVRVLSSKGFRLPTALVLFFKNLLYLNGFAAAVAPDTDLLTEVGPILAYFRDKHGEKIEAVLEA